MESNPVVLVLSCGVLTPPEIIKNIIDVNGGQGSIKEKNSETNNLTKHSCEIKTKYYSITVDLVPHQGDIGSVSEDILGKTEVLIYFFNSEDTVLLENVPKLRDISKKFENIGLVILLTNSLGEDRTSGLTYPQIKSKFPALFDIIEICDGNEEESLKPQYSEVVEVLQNYVWANIEHKDANGSSLLLKKQEELSSSGMEDQLEAFEKLLINIQNYKKVFSSLEREQALDEAEKIAEIFESIINEN